MGETGLVSTLQGVPSKSTLKRGPRTIRYQPHSAQRDSVRTGIRKSEAARDGSGYSLSRRTGEGQGEGPFVGITLSCPALVPAKTRSPPDQASPILASSFENGLFAKPEDCS